MRPVPGRRGSGTRAGPSGISALGAVVLALVGLLLTQAPAARAGGRGDARVIGTFTMLAVVTEAVNVNGESPGQILTRAWAIRPRRCRRDSCQSLVLVRQRSDGFHSALTLSRTGPGSYAGTGVFYVALRCRRRVYPLGSRAPYRITLVVERSTLIGGIRFATTVGATYVNAARSDTTPCPLESSHDAAIYAGNVSGGLPGAPRASFTATVHGASGAVSFRDTSRPGRGNGRIVRRAWSFGDPASRHRNTSTLRKPVRVYSRPGRYRVHLRVVDADGLSATTAATVTIPVSTTTVPTTTVPTTTVPTTTVPTTTTPTTTTPTTTTPTPALSARSWRAPDRAHARAGRSRRRPAGRPHTGSWSGRRP